MCPITFSCLPQAGLSIAPLLFILSSFMPIQYKVVIDYNKILLHKTCKLSDKVCCTRSSYCLLMHGHCSITTKYRSDATKHHSGLQNIIVALRNIVVEKRHARESNTQVPRAWVKGHFFCNKRPYKFSMDNKRF
jgi:hypothetical protein